MSKYLIVVIIFCTNFLSAQIFWSKSSANPILQPGTPGFWDGAQVYAPSVILDNDEYKMWYAGSDGINFRIGLATSSDGINWNKYDWFPVMYEGSAGSWDGFYVTHPSVLVEDNIYKMWYTGWAGGGYSNYKIGYAISANGINWDKYDFNPVLTASTIGNWDPLGVFSPSVVLYNGIYHMWFTGHDGNKKAIGYATSADGINWNWYQGNPVLEGDESSWDKEVGNCNVLILTDGYYMWYVGFDSNTSKIGFAFSNDGVSWIKHEDNPVLINEGSTWEQFAVDESTVIRQFFLFKMWYSGFAGLNQSQIGLADELIINVDEEENKIPNKFILHQNYPNSFNPSTKIKFQIPGQARNDIVLITLKVYDALGKEIATLVNEEKPAGEYEVEFNAIRLTSGIYFYQLKSGDFIDSKKMILLK